MSGRAAQGEAARPAAAGGSPRTVIRGESGSDEVLAIIDYLRFTFLPSVSIPAALEQVRRYMAMWFSMPLNFVPSDKGMFGYESSHDVMVWKGGEMMRIAIIAAGGTTAGNTMMVDMSGQGCALVNDWRAVYATIQDLDARITRVDTALDLFQGFDIDQFDDMYFAGDFNCGGRIPSRRAYEAGNSHDKYAQGRTLYLGKKVNGKELCIYEKGKQLGDAESEWLRVEIRFGNRDRVIPHDVLLYPTKYFAGAFVALEQLVDSMAEKIVTNKRDHAEEEHAIVLKRLVHFARASYGKLFFQLAEEIEHDYKAVFDMVHMVGVPRRLHKSTLACGVNQAHVLA